MSMVVGKSHLQNKESLQSIDLLHSRQGCLYYVASYWTDALMAMSSVHPKYIFCSRRDDFDRILSKGSSVPIIILNYSYGSESYYEEYFKWHNEFYGKDMLFGYAFNLIKGDNTGARRLKAIKHLMLQSDWIPSQKHFLFGLTNPAETILYKKGIHSLRARNSISGFVSDRCFIDSAIGINYQFWRTDNSLFKALNKNYLEVEYTNEIQYANFILNDITMKGFCDGTIGLHFWESVMGEI
jgi:hypothetical protein